MLRYFFRITRTHSLHAEQKSQNRFLSQKSEIKFFTWPVFSRTVRVAQYCHPLSSVCYQCKVHVCLGTYYSAANLTTHFKNPWQFWAFLILKKDLWGVRTKVNKTKIKGQISEESWMILPDNVAPHNAILVALWGRLPLDHDGLVGPPAGNDVLWRSARWLLWERDTDRQTKTNNCLALI